MSKELQDQSFSKGHQELKELLAKGDAGLWAELERRTKNAAAFNELIGLSTMRKRALKRGLLPPGEAVARPLRVALVGGSTLYPLSELVEHLLAVAVGPVELMSGDYNNYRSEILDELSGLYDFDPDFVVILPDEKSCRYTGRLTDSRERVADEVERSAAEILGLCAAVRKKCNAEVVLCNYIPPAYFDLGPLRVKTPASDWNFRRAVNTAIGSSAPNYVHVCDMEFLAYRLGGLAARDERGWFESKQLCSPPMLISLAREIAHIIASVKKAPKKILVLDLDNTLWGGVIGDDGIEGIELGDTSPRGEAFRAFQSYVLSLTDRGLLLGVCSKNDFENAIEPFRRHPEMVLKEEHFVSFKANWEPKAQNLIEMADELSLGLDSFIFVDDNPAEIEIVRQFAPEVTTILLDQDPSSFVRQLQESRLFERAAITGEDLRRTQQYREEATRRSLQASCVDLESYLRSLEMSARIAGFNELDLPRIAQLINKSNQFNLTTIRRTEPELHALMNDPRYAGFTIRLSDRFGDHGLIAVVICRIAVGGALEVDTWLMSCRVLKRQVEEETLNEIVRLAREAGCALVKGTFIPTAKNGMVRDLYPRLGFATVSADDDRAEYELLTEEYSPIPTAISIDSRPLYDEHRTNRSTGATAVHI